MRKQGSRKNGERKRRGSRGAGRLYKRGPRRREYPADSTASGAYWLAYVIPNPEGGKGQVIRQALREADGTPITDRARAEAERKRILAPYQTGQHVETLKAIAARLQDAEARHVQAVDQANPR